MVSLRNLVLAMIAGVVLLVCLVSMQAGSRKGYSCAVCRLYRSETVLFGFRRQAETTNECSMWYREHIERDHEHIWKRASSCEAMLNGLGQRIGCACGMADFASYQIPAVVQMHVYQHFKDPMKAKQLFANLADERTANERLGEFDESRVKLTFQSLCDWEIAGFPDTWEVWWDRWWKLHLADHN